MKKPILTSAAALAVSSLLLFASCGEVRTSFSSNWYANTALSTSIGDTFETLTYTVSYEKGSNEYAQVSYENGVYTTTLTNAIYDWEDGSHDNVYVYKTQLTLDVTYTVAGKSESYRDEISSVSVFRTVNENLRPVYSEKTVRAHSLLRSNPIDFDQDVGAYHYSLRTTYNKDVTKAKLVYTDLSDDSQKVTEHKIDDNYTYLDNEQLLFAIRGMNIAASASETVNVLNTSRGIVQPVKITNSAVATMTPAFTVNGKKVEEESIAYNQLSVAIDDLQSGVAQTCYYAKTVSQTANTYRNVMIVNRSVLPYNMGTLVYTLDDANFTDK